MNIIISNSGDKPIYEQITSQIKECLQEAVDMARIAHIPCEELKDVLAAMYDEG